LQDKGVKIFGILENSKIVQYQLTNIKFGVGSSSRLRRVKVQRKIGGVFNICRLISAKKMAGFAAGHFFNLTVGR
jgi:hypothetical protein